MDCPAGAESYGAKSGTVVGTDVKSDCLFCASDGSTLSTAGAVPLPRWGRLSGIDGVSHFPYANIYGIPANEKDPSTSLGMTIRGKRSAQVMR